MSNSVIHPNRGTVRIGHAECDARKEVSIFVTMAPELTEPPRWTSALKDKRGKLRRYAQKGIIAPTDCAVIAINSCRLSDFVFDDCGISKLPFALEAVFPIGPTAIPTSLDGKPAGEVTRTPRFTIRKTSHRHTDHEIS